ncbi:hypothetical protein [Microcoleus sp. AT9b-C5]|uniref:hypothetical protein n=1 Tax=unclassified Microcoleus TaxID=2642155 RepID=UPI002FD06D16
MTFSVVQGILDPGVGNMIQIDTNHWFNWLTENKSFRYESRHHAPFTARKEKTDYWYGYRKVAGKLHKRYIGKSLELNSAKLEEIAEALNVPPQPREPRVTDTVTEKVESVAETVVGTVTEERVLALELQVQSLQKALEAVQEALPGKSESGNSEELPTVTESELQIELGNLKTENEALRDELAKVKSYYLDMLQRSVHRVEGLLKENEALKAENEALRVNQPSAEFELPEAFDVLNEVKAIPKYRDTKIGIVDAILGIIGKLTPNGGN